MSSPFQDDALRASVVQRDDSTKRGLLEVSALPEAPSNGVTILALSYVALAFAVVTFAAIGPTFVLLLELVELKPLMASVWRNQVCFCFFLPLAAVQWCCTPREKRATWFTRKVCGYVLAAGLAWGSALAVWVVALTLTTTVRASLLATTHPFMLMVYLLARGRPCKLPEIALMFVCLVGLVVSELQPLLNSSNSRNLTPEQMYLGDALCLVAAFCNMIQVLSATNARQTVPVFVYSTLATLVSICFIAPFALWEAGAFNPRIWERDGIVGWVSLPGHLKFVWIGFGFVVGVVGLACWNFALRAIRPLISSTSRLVEPAVCGVISWAMGIESVPGPLTIVGGVVIVAALAGLIFLQNTAKTAEIRPVQDGDEALPSQYGTADEVGVTDGKT